MVGGRRTRAVQVFEPRRLWRKGRDLHCRRYLMLLRLCLTGSRTIAWVPQLTCPAVAPTRWYERWITVLRRSGARGGWPGRRRGFRRGRRRYPFPGRRFPGRRRRERDSFAGWCRNRRGWCPGRPEARLLRPPFRGPRGWRAGPSRIMATTGEAVMKSSSRGYHCFFTCSA